MQFISQIVYIPLLLLLVVASVQAEFHCSAELSYSWRKEKEEKSNEVQLRAVEAKGADEEGAKAKLAADILIAKSNGVKECHDRHENSAGCIAAKHTSMANVLQGLGFSAKKALEAAIIEDCKNSSGRCLEVVASEPKCKDLSPKVEASPAAAAPEKGKKK